MGGIELDKANFILANKLPRKIVKQLGKLLPKENMKILWKDSPINQLPISGELAPAFGISLVIAILMVAVSIGGLLFPSEIYSTDELLQSFVANDVVNLVIGLPTLLLSMCVHTARQADWFAIVARSFALFCL